jgi:D-alanyl-lipoteichoic acid acyltransferase DltB (MBOAT superfamily)
VLFNSFVFIFVFLPVVCAGFFVLARTSHRLAAGWLTVASLAFYGWWNPPYVALLLASIAVNYTLGRRLALLHKHGRKAAGRRLLIVAVGTNLALLGYFKYADFFVASVRSLAGGVAALPEIVLPLGISFYTFTQIAFLVDAQRGLARESNLVHYALFVSWFPHLIAGPILHHREMMPQFRLPSTYRLDWENVAVGLTLFVIGLFKKTVIADGVAVFVTPAFAAAAAGTPLTLLEAWGAALAFTFQIYFDFSGYTDMALGASRMFGIVLPLNFQSPYKSAGIIDFWRRWHITLSRFLRDYVYIPLGGNRDGAARTLVNLLATMLIGGLWHGAGWTFVAWGALHGVYLVINHGWRAIRRRVGLAVRLPEKLLGVALTFVAVVVGWVLFRAPTFGAAVNMLDGMAGRNGIVLPQQWTALRSGTGAWLAGAGVTFGPTAHFDRIAEFNWIAGLLVACWFLPNSQEILAAFRPALVTRGYGEIRSAGRFGWQPNIAWLMLVAVLGVYALLSISGYSEFIYYRF